MFMITTLTGARVFGGVKDGGLERSMADASCKERNQRAQALGLTARYVVVPYVGLKK